MRSFTDKGRLSQLLINMPVRVILESRAALLGAAAYAEARAAELSGGESARPSFCGVLPANHKSVQSHRGQTFCLFRPRWDADNSSKTP